MVACDCRVVLPQVEVVGPVARVGEGGVGVVLADPGPGAFARSRDALARLLGDPGLPDRCRNLALGTLSLAGGTDAYLDLYREVLAKVAPPGGSASTLSENEDDDSPRRTQRTQRKAKSNKEENQLRPPYPHLNR